MSITGSCLCGKVELSVVAAERDAVTCHCQQCRKQSGHFIAATRVENSDFSVTGEQYLTWYKASAEAERGFCKLCGSTLFWRSVNSEHTSILTGCLDSPTGLTLTHHIYVADKGDYYSLDDGKPVFAQSD